MLGAAVAPFFGIDNKAMSVSLSAMGLLIAVLILYIGFRIDPDER